MTTLGILLAAGASRRFGFGDKLMADYRGQPLVRHAAAALAGSGCDALAAVLSSPRVADALPGGFARHFVTPGLPMAASFRAAIACARQAGADRLLLCLGDMPHVQTATLRRLLARDRSTACVCDDVRMPPLLLMSRDFPRLDGIEGDQGARPLVRGLAPQDLVPVAPFQAIDIDSAADLARAAGGFPA